MSEPLQMRYLLIFLIIFAGNVGMQGQPAAPLPEADGTIYTEETLAVEETTLLPDTLAPLTTPVADESLVKQLAHLGDTSCDVHWGEFAVGAGVFAASALFVRTPWLVHWREEVQHALSHHGKDKTEVDNWIQYAPMIVGWALPFTGYKSQHNLLDRTILLAMSYATFGIVNFAMKQSFKEQRPDTGARNSFPSGHTGTVFMGAEYLRREYWDKNKWVAMSGYAVGVAVGYLRIHNDRHWINDVVGGAALGYLSTTFAYWLYPKIFRKRARMHRDELQQSLSTSQRSDRSVTWALTPVASGGFYGVSGGIVF